MITSAERIIELATLLGTTDGLQRVSGEIDALNTRLAEKESRLSREELMNLGAALATLSGAIADMSRVARSMLVEAGVAANHVG